MNLAECKFKYGEEITEKIKTVAIQTPLSFDDARLYVLSGRTLETFNVMDIPLGRNAYGEIAMNQ